MAVDFATEMGRAGALYSDYPENLIILPELNGRHEHTDVEDLAADIAANGQDTPVLIRKDDAGRPVLAAGHRRWRAIMLLNERNPNEKRKILCRYKPLSDSEAFTATIRENRFRKDVSPIDDSVNINTLKTRFSLTEQDIARIYFPDAKTDSEKADALRFVKLRAGLVELAPEAAQAVREGRMKITAAAALAKLTKEKQREKVAAPGKIKVAAVTKPKAAKDDNKNVHALYAAEELAKAVDRWTEDATPEAESALLKAHKAYRKLIPAAKGELAPIDLVVAAQQENGAEQTA